MLTLPFRFKKPCFKKIPVISFISFIILIIFYPFGGNLDDISYISFFLEIILLLLMVGAIIIQITAQNRKFFLSGRCRKTFSSFMPFCLYMVSGYIFLLLRIHFFSDKYFLTFEVSAWNLRLVFDLLFVCVILLFASGLAQKFFPSILEELDYQEFHLALRRANQMINRIERKKEVTCNINDELLANFRTAKKILEKNKETEGTSEYHRILNLIDQLNIIIKFLENRKNDHRFFLVEYGINFKETYPSFVDEFNKTIKLLNQEFEEELDERAWISNFA